MMVDALILPLRPMTDETIDEVVDQARNAGLIACNAMQGPFRIAFFKPSHIPKGWARFGLAIKEAPTCAA